MNFTYRVTETSGVYRQAFDIEHRTDMGVNDKRFLFVLNVIVLTLMNKFRKMHSPCKTCVLSFIV